MPEFAIKAECIHKTFRTGAASAHVLRGVDLAVWPGEFVFLVGPSGSGKSTLLAILGCVLTPDEGRLRVLDCDVGGFRSTRLAQFRARRIGFVFQRFHLFRGLSVIDNVRLPLSLVGAPSKRAQAEAVQLLEEVGLGRELYRSVTELSVGQCQRVALARALAGDPDLILADEPTASLDATAGNAAMTLLRRLAKERCKTVVVVTHDTRIFSLADRILHLNDGRIVDGDPTSGHTQLRRRTKVGSP